MRKIAVGGGLAGEKDCIVTASLHHKMFALTAEQGAHISIEKVPLREAIDALVKEGAWGHDSLYNNKGIRNYLRTFNIEVRPGGGDMDEKQTPVSGVIYWLEMRKTGMVRCRKVTLTAITQRM
ncbi:MAG: hypothetical protein PHS53_00240 [Candidatus Pacebacteria bacterium]|nr:hypothetical protein [Candidatus Paceibacterota bacterium]